MKENHTNSPSSHCWLRYTLLLLVFVLSMGDAFSVAPTANFTASNQAICINNSTTFTNTSTGTISTYSWNFGSGASPATASTSGPHTVTYSSIGMKTITLTVTGPDGTSTLTKTNYIAVGVDRIKLMTYNVLNYGDVTADTSLRNPYFRTIMAASDPDILVVQEMTSLQGMNGFLSNIMNATSNQYSKGLFINGYDSDNGIFYKTSKFSFISNTPIQTDLRDINEFKIVHTLTGDTLRIFSVHLKANAGGPDDPGQRAKEVDSLRKYTNTLPAGKDFVVCGDFNIYNSTESAYVKLLADNPSDDGNFLDPLTLTGTWNQAGYSLYHTQSTRDTALGTGGSSGGMNDRFDMILYSNAINQSGGINYVSGSTQAYGNDGLHYNQSIYLSPNNAVGTTVATALYNASDHLPVILNLDFLLNNCQALNLGATALVSPTSPACPSSQKTVQVRITNLGVNSINFSQNNADVVLQVTNPSSSVSTITQTINSGVLAPSATMDVTFNNVNMSITGTYTINANTVFGPDVNSQDNAMPAASVTVTAPLATTISPPGPLTICTGSSVNLTANNGSNYLWSNGMTTQTINVNAGGNYSVNFTDVNACLSTAAAVSITQTSFQASYTVVSENMGTVSTTTAISTHEANNGFQNTALTMSGTGDVRNTIVSSGYTTASGNANIFLTNTVGKNFLISGINTLNTSNLRLYFGLYKSSSGSTGSDFLVKYSIDGTTFTPLTFPPLATGNANWQYVTVNETLPAASNLRILFEQNGTATQYRIDDVLLASFFTTPVITPPGPLNICQGNSVVLNASAASSYLWSNGATTQNITVSTGGNYSVTETSSNGCTSTSNTVIISSNPNLTAGVSISSNSGSTICSGTSVTFTATTTNGGTAPSYQWKKGTTNVGTNSAAYTSSTLSSGDVITCVMTSNGVCITGNPATSNAITMTVTPAVSPSVSISANTSNTICPGTSVTFTAVPVNGGTTPSYQWKKGTTNVGTNSSTYSTSTLVNGDVITCQLTSNASCVTGNPGTSNAITFTVRNNPSLASITPSSGFTGTIVTLNGTGFTGATAVRFNGLNASFTISNDNQITATVPAGSTTGLVTVITPCGTSTGSVTFTQSVSSVTLNLKLYIEGYYASGGFMVAVASPSTQPLVCDTIELQLASPVSPFSIVYSGFSLLMTNGTSQFTLPSSFSGNNYYLIVRHRNALETWSASAITLSNNMTYDFSDLSSKSYGSDTKDLLDGRFAFRSGDVNQDGLIDYSDFDAIKNDALLFKTGYLSTDLNGDGIIESADLSIVENNLPRFFIHP